MHLLCIGTCMINKFFLYFVLFQVLIQQRSVPTENSGKTKPETQPINQTESDRDSSKCEPQRVKIFDGGFVNLIYFTPLHKYFGGHCVLKCDICGMFSVTNRMRSMCTLEGVEEENTSVRNVESAARNLACCGNTSVLIRTSVHFTARTATSLSRPKVGSGPNTDLKAKLCLKFVFFLKW